MGRNVWKGKENSQPFDRLILWKWSWKNCKREYRLCNDWLRFRRYSSFLYGPGVASRGERIKKQELPVAFHSWEPTIDQQEVTLEIGAEKILALYWEFEGDSMQVTGIQNEESIKQIIENSRLTYVLKIKIDESPPNEEFLEWLDSLQQCKVRKTRRKIMKYRIRNIEIKCPNCQNDTFDFDRRQLNTKGATFFGLDWANRDAFLLVCRNCTYISWYMDEPRKNH